MLSRHGSLESAILGALWSLESDGIYTNSVKDVFDILSQSDDEKRAYTTCISRRESRVLRVL